MTDVCSDGTNTVTLSCDTGLASVIWYNSTGTQVGTGCDLVVNNSMIGTGLVGQSECFYYEADDSSSCPGNSCCPVNVTVLNCMTCSVAGVDPTCNGMNNGSATVTPANGVAPFSYAWSSGQTTATAGSLGAGTYTVTVTDAAGGTSTCSVTLTDPPALTCSVTTTNTNCFGLSDGSAVVTAMGGTGSYSYSWSNGITNASNPNLAAGTYTVTVTDAEGCTQVCSGVVTEPSALVLTAVVQDLSCNAANGPADGAVDITASGGTGAYAYSWTTTGGSGLSGTSEDQTGLTVGTYEVVVTDDNGCTAAYSATLAEPAVLTCNASGVDETDCGAEDGTITVTAAGGTASYSYEINGGTPQASGTFNNLSAGTYTILTTDANGCTVECSATINAPSTPMCTISNNVDVSCNGGTDGSFDVTGTGGSGSYEYSLDGTAFQASGSFSNLAAGSYTVTVRNVGLPACVSTCNITIVEPTVLGCAVAGNDVTCSGGSDGSATVTASGGTMPYSYAWGTTPVQTTATATMLLEGSYSVTVTDDNGCTTACNVTIAGPTALSCTLTKMDVTCNGLSDGSVTAAAAGGTSAYEYSLDGGAFQTSPTFASLAAGSYVVTTRDANLCETSCTIVVAEPDALTCTNVATDATDCAVDDGTITTTPVGGTSPYTYALNGGASQAADNFSGLGAGTYTVLVTDTNGCTTECTATINTPAAPMCSITSSSDVLCNGGADGSLTAEGSGGNGSFEYSLDGTVFQSSGVFSNLVAGSYSVTVRNVGNPMCISTCNVTITEPVLLTCTATSEDTSCEGGSDGEATVVPANGTAPYTYIWDDAAAQTTATIMNLAAGTYTVTVTDSNGCTSTCTTDVNSPLAVSCSLTATDVSCAGGSDGTVTVSGAGGAMPYEYSLDGGAYQAGSTFNGLVAGSYIVAIRDANMCISNCSIVVNEPPAVSCTVTTNDATDCSVDDGSLTVTGVGGTGVLEYSLNGGAYQTSGTFSGLAGGTYTVTVQDANGCTSTCDGTINTPSAPSCSIINTTDVSCNGLSDGNLTAEGSGGSGTYEYSIDGVVFQPSGIFSDLAAGSHTITVINAGQQMCTSTCTAFINQPTTLSCTTTKTDVTCNGGSDGSASAVAAGGVGPYTYAWDDAAASTTASVIGLPVGSYTVTITDSNGCTTSCTAMLISPPTVMCSLTSMDVTCNGGMDGIIIISGTGGNMPYEYSIDGMTFQTGNVFNNLAAGNYVITIRDANACMSSCNIDIIEPTALTCTASATDATDCGVDDGTVTAAGAEGTPGYEYSLNGSAYQAAGTFNNLGSGTYTVTVRDINGCTSECTATVNTPSAPMCNITMSQDVSCEGLSDGSLTAEGTGGSGSYEYSLDGITFGASGTFTDLAPGSYTVTVRNAGDPMCTSTCNVTISEPALLSCSTTSTDVSCDGDLDGTATVTELGGTAPYAYAWNNGQTSGTAIDLAAGTYVVTVTDANGCTAWCDVMVAEPMPLACSLNVVDEDCDSGMPGSITVTTTGGVMPFEYSLDGTTWQPANVFNNLTAGTYTVSVRDMNLCMTDCTAEVMTVPCSNYDLALLKNIVTPGPYVPGQDVTYEIVVCNQGELDANFFQVTDNIPAGMTLSSTAGVNGGWMGPVSGPVTYDYTNLLPSEDPDACVSIFLTLTIDPSFMGTSIVNEAEITADDGDDSDSDPTVDDGPDTDGDMNDGADDEDPETITVGQAYDLAMTKQVVTPGPYMPGQDVTFAIEVCNQGTLDANFFELTDHIPSGFTLSTTAGTNAGWVGGLNGDVTYAYNSLLPATNPDACTTVNITLTVEPVFMGTTLVNNAEITADDGDDIDSDPTVYSNPNDFADDNSLTETDGGDDEDPEQIMIGQVYDLALTKQVVTPGPYTAGQDVAYSIQVCNQGTLDANYFEVTDHIPSGMSLSTTAGTNAGWVGGPTGAVVYSNTALLPASDPDACTTISITLTIDPTYMGTTLVNNAELTDDDGNDVDSDPDVFSNPDDFADDNSLTEADGGDDEDPEQIMVGQVYDLALIKEVVTPGPYVAGQDVTYEITVCNQGTLDANSIEITDNIPAGMTLSTAAGANGGWMGAATGPVTYSYSNLLPAQDPDACFSAFITLTIEPTFAGGGLLNLAELTADDGDDVDSDPTMDDGPDTDNDFNDGADDEDPEAITVEAPLMSIGSTVFSDDNDNGVQDPGEDAIGSGSKAGKAVSLDLYDANTGALVATTTTDANGSYLFDNLPAGDYYIEFIPPASLPVSSSTTSTVDDQVDGDDNGIQVDTNGDGVTDGVITSPVITLAPGTEPTGEPGTNGGKDAGNDANGDMTIDFGLVPLVLEYDLALTKEVMTTSPYSPGQDVTYAITVCNQGDVDANFFEITDHIPTGMSLSTAAGANAGWVGGPTGAVTYAYNNLLAAADPDACAIVNITLTIDAGFMGTSLVNNAEITNDDGDDIDSDPTVFSNPDDFAEDNSLTETDGGDDEDPEEINLGQTYDLALIKQVMTPGPYSVGQDVTYDIMVCNQGTLDANYFEVTDHIPAGMTLSTTAGANAGWVGGPTGSVTYAYNTLLPATDPDACASISITLTIDPSFTGTSLMNNAELTDDDGDDIDSDPTMDDGPDSDDSMTDGADDEDPEEIMVTHSLSIGSTVFSDDNNNGIQDPGEDSLGSGSKAGKSVTLELYDATTGALVATTTTDANGSYLFDNLAPGDYYIEFFPPASLPVSSTTTSTADDQVDGDDNGIQQDSNGDGLTDGVISSPVITLAPGTEPVGEPDTNGGKDAGNDANGDMTIDFGLVPLMSVGSTVFLDANDNGVQDAGEDAIGSGTTAGKTVLLELYDAAGNLIATTTTDATGSYIFDNLLPGDYYIEFVPPSSFPISSTPTNTSDDQVDGDDNGIQQDIDGDGFTDGVITSPVFELAPGTEPVGETGTHGGKDSAADSNGDMTIDFGLLPAPVFDLALTKVLTATGPFMPGDVISFELTVINQGDVTATNTVVTDNSPAGLIYQSSTADANVTDNGDETFTVASLPAMSSQVIEVFYQIDPASTATSMINDAEITATSGTDVDSTPGDNSAPNDTANDDDVTDTTGGDDQDPAEVTIVQPTPVFDLALFKQLAAGQSSMVDPGDAISYTITVMNQGSVSADNISVTDYIPTGLNFEALSNSAWVDNLDGTATAILSVANGLLPVGGLASGTQASIDIILNVAHNAPQGMNLMNWAEISAATDDTGSPVTDTDSTPDTDQTNDTFGGDDEINNGGGDEDDHDPAEVTVRQFDLALVKSLANGQSSLVVPGDLVTFTITVQNQGNIAADNIRVVDYVPTCMTIADANWTNTNPVEYTFSVASGLLPAGGLAAGASVSIDITLQVDATADATCDFTNWSEIAGHTDTDGDPIPDSDSTPDTDNTNDNYGGTGVTDNSGGDEDDHDDAVVTFNSIYDLALTKVYSSYIDNNVDGTINPGDDVIFTITVFNQGTVGATNVEVTDYLPSGLMLSALDMNGWTGSGTGISNTILSLDPQSSSSVDIQVTIDPAFMGTSIVNAAEISNSDSNADIDSNADGDSSNDTFVTDDDITSTGGDEDDHDLAEIMLQQQFDLALTKDYVDFVDSDGTGDITAGDEILYTITVYNQGSLDGTNIEVTDYIPTGMFLSNNDTNGWVGSSAGPVTNTIASVPANGAPATVDILLTIDPGFMGQSITNWAEISNDNNGGDIDSTPDGVQFDGAGETDDLGDDNVIDNTNGDEDDHDPAQILVGQVFDLALMKMVVPGQADSYEVFDDIEYAITIYNQGTVDAYNVDVIDYIQAGQELSPNDNNGWMADGTGNYMNTIPGPVRAGSSETVYITLRVTQEAYTLQLDSLFNIAEIAGSTDIVGVPQDDMDSTPDMTQGNDAQMDNITDNSGGDEDDEDPAYADIKPLDPLGYIYCEKTGQLVTGGVVDIQGPGAVIYGMDADGVPFDGRSGMYQFFVTVPGVYNMTYIHPAGFPLSTTCAAFSGVYDPSAIDGTATDLDGVVNNQIVLGSDTINGGMIDYSCTANPYFLSVDIQPADPPIINNNNIPVQCAAIASTVCEDTNLNGIAETTDPGFDGILVELYDCADLTTPIATQTTANGGQYNFGGLPAGCYRLHFNNPSDYGVIGSGVVDNAGWSTDLVVNYGECNNTATYCLTLANAAIGDIVWHDINGNGIYDAGEPGLPGVKVYLFNDNGFVVGFTYTDSNGNYLFEGLNSGHYYVQFEDPDGYSLTGENRGNNDNTDSDVDHSNGPGTTAITFLDPAEVDLSWDAGYYQCVPVGDFVWLDNNNNNNQDSNENGINGIKVNLYKVVNGISVLFDDSYTGHKPGTASDDGYFKFCAPPGDYYLHFEATSSMTAVSSGVGNSELDSDVNGSNGANTTSTFTIISGDHRCDVDAGYTVSAGFQQGPIAAHSTGSYGTVSLLGFQGKSNPNAVILDWKVENEADIVEFYKVLKLEASGKYNTLGKILSENNIGEISSYEFNDFGFEIGANSYKIEAYDFNDELVFDSSLAVEVEESYTYAVLLYPTITTSFVNLKVSVDQISDFIVNIVSSDGSLAIDRIIDTELDRGDKIFRISTKELDPGIYFVNMRINNEFVTEKLIVVGY